MSSWRGRLGHPALVRGAQLAIGAVFVVSGLAKIGDPASFATQIHNFRLVPIWSENLIALCLPWIETVAGLALLLKIRQRSGALIAAALMVLFTLGVLQAVVRGLDFACGCFGTADATRVGLWKLVENAVLTAVALAASGRASGGLTRR